MRYFFQRRIPPFTRLAVVESGPRQLMEQFLKGFLEANGEEIETVDLVTCYSSEPSHLPPGGRVLRTTDYGGAEGRRRLCADLAGRRPTVLVVLGAESPILFKWKIYLSWKIAAKVLVVNENGDYFFLDWGHWSTLVEFALTRAGLQGAAAAPTLARLLAFPFTAGYLALYALSVHLRRRIRA
jgi:hypothetical protein